MPASPAASQSPSLSGAVPSACPDADALWPSGTISWHAIREPVPLEFAFVLFLFFYFFSSAAQKMSLLNSSFALGHVLLTFILLVLSIYAFPAFKNNHVQFLFSKERRKILPQIPKQNREKNLEETLGLSFILLLSKFIL